MPEDLRKLAARLIDKAVSTGRAQNDEGFFPCAIKPDDPFYDKDANVMCENMLRDFEIPEGLFDE